MHRSDWVHVGIFVVQISIWIFIFKICSNVFFSPCNFETYRLPTDIYRKLARVRQFRKDWYLTAGFSMLQNRDTEQRQGELDSRDGLQCTADKSATICMAWYGRVEKCLECKDVLFPRFLLFTVQFSDGETWLERTVFPFSWGHRLPPLECNHTCWHRVNLNKWLLGPYRRQISNRPEQLRIHYPKSPSTYFTGGLEVGQLIQY